MNVIQFPVERIRPAAVESRLTVEEARVVVDALVCARNELATALNRYADAINQLGIVDRWNPETGRRDLDAGAQLQDFVGFAMQVADGVVDELAFEEIHRRAGGA